SEGQPTPERLTHSIQDSWLRVSQNGRPPAPHVVDIGLTVFVRHPRPRGAPDERRISTDGAVGADGAVDPTDQDSFGALLDRALAHLGRLLHQKLSPETRGYG